MTFIRSSYYVSHFYSFSLTPMTRWVKVSTHTHTHSHTHAQGDPSVQPFSGVYMMTSLCLIQPNKISIKLKWWSMMNTGNRFHYIVYTHMCVSEVCLPKTESFSLFSATQSQLQPANSPWLGSCDPGMGGPSPHHYCQIKSQKPPAHLSPCCRLLSRARPLPRRAEPRARLLRMPWNSPQTNYNQRWF